MWEVSHLQSFCCFALALASMAFIQNCFRLAQLVLLGPLLLLLSQANVSGSSGETGRGGESDEYVFP